MLPLSMSAVMVGLGMVAGILRWYPPAFTFPYLPAVPHIMLVLPFVIRLMVPAIERIDPKFAEQASLLPIGKIAYWWHSRGAFLVVPATMAASLCLAFSMGEFGATFLMVRVGSWDSLSILVDQVASRPKFDPYVFPTAMALATILMVVTLLILSRSTNKSVCGGQGMMFEIRKGSVHLGGRAVFEDLDLALEAGEIVSILGPSGCGKTTLLRACCGLERLVTGQRFLAGSPIDNQTIVSEITMLFQQPILYPHLNVTQNIALGSSGLMTKADLKRRISEVLSSIGLDGFEQRSIAGLSGGEAQRVAFGRALMQEPNVILLDEPFASVDVKRRLELTKMTRKHLKERGMTALHVTHDLEEAEVLSDRILHWNELSSTHHEAKKDDQE